MAVASWGKHAILNIYRGATHRIQCADNVKRFSQDLVKRIDMVPYGPPQVQRFGSDDKAGLTLVQLIETSNITGHFCDKTGDAYIDVFSCKPFDVKAVEQAVREYFRPENIQSQVFDRQAVPSKRADYP
jgi:S-adenosylmethionine/arginine decarboxylase-like enzyme